MTSPVLPSFSVSGLTAEDAFDGDVEITASYSPFDEDTRVYLSREEAIRLRDWLNRFIDLTDPESQ